MVRIAVEEPLTDVKQELINKGYDTEVLDMKVEAIDYDLVVVRDKEDMADLHMNVQLVEAKGRSVEEIVEKVEDHLKRAGKIEKTSKTVEKQKKKMTGKGFLAGMATGTAIGAAVGMMYAPTEGKTTRTNLTNTATQTKTKTTAMVNKVKDTTDKAKNKMPGGNKKDDSTTEIAPKETVEPETPPTTSTTSEPTTPPIPPKE